ncbi:MAG: GIY-YIG nuclease family protein [Burkholderiales bacterium]|jgi:putative endonuclease|nr:GIY-YIG nuclease family protein [Burkholderiales bacterium]
MHRHSRVHLAGIQRRLLFTRKRGVRIHDYHCKRHEASSFPRASPPKIAAGTSLAGIQCLFAEFRYDLPSQPSHTHHQLSDMSTRDEKQPAVYIILSKRNGTLYIGVTSNLVQRVWQHRNDAVEGFSKKYQTHILAYYELHDNMESAILREKQLKKWERQWKIRLIEKSNPYWRDLYSEIVG